ncbi:hypothetical protein JTE90_018032 [Oedothorax gibbosus]|uniref:CWF19-like protein 2 n=1 Tax=Oedothorax gibbosus TaxID=931172 RepID=A0AAV6VA36_9ARAC|nr:hypothetical protein JTE90_018032 [Oedothorax gibbosus]
MEDTREKKHHKSSGKHKHKKSKKHKHKKEKHSSSSGSDSDNGAVEWVEAPAPKVEKRESWMQDESFVPTLTREQMTSGLTSREKKRQAEAKKKEEEKEFMKSRELNPNWDKSGTGLPQEDKPHDETPRLPNHSVGDGGYGHLVKARQRLREQADREGRSMEDVAVERWGSLATLDAMIVEAEERMHQLSGNRHRNDRGSPDYRHEKSYKFQKPSNYDRHHRKSKNNVYSSRRSTSSSSSHYRDNSPDKEYSSRENDNRKTSASSSLYRDKSPDRKSSEVQREETSRQPAWKKVKPVEGGERKHHGSSSEKGNSETSSPSSSLYIGKSPHRKSFEMQRETARQPAWKKVADAENKHEASEHSNSPESPKMPSSNKEDTSNKSFNQLAAKRMRDALLGNSKPTPRDEETVHNKPRETHRVMLTKIDSSGQQRPVTSSREESGFERKTDRKQKRHKYFDDSSKYSLNQMFEREKLTTTEDNIEMYMEVSAQCDDSLEDNETSDISKKAIQKMGHTNQEEKDIKKAIHQHQKLNLALEKCQYCLDQPNMKQHLIVTIQEQVFVCIPNFQTLTEGHCLIVPKRHVPSFLALDEDEWNGFQEALSSVRRLFRARGKSVLCMETSLNFGRCPHAYAECIPVPEEEGDLAPLYFKKSILESEEEWTHNVKLVDLTKKGLRRSIPKNLPYFAIFFDPAVHGGYAHVIEDEKAFPRNFGKEVVGGILDVNYNLYKNTQEDSIKKLKEAAHLTKIWNFLFKYINYHSA